jgi:hypothetical protein
LTRWHVTGAVAEACDARGCGRATEGRDQRGRERNRGKTRAAEWKQETKHKKNTQIQRN